MHSLQFIEVNTHPTPDCSVIWLHGLGADGHDFEGMVHQLQLPKKLGIRFIFPHAPVQPVSINGGYPMRSWFDILGLDATATQDEPGIRRSEQMIHHLIDKILATGISSKKIVIGGFSQGGALALHVALRYSSQLAGTIGLSTFLPLWELAREERDPVNETLPIFLAHGTFDNVVPYLFGEMSRKMLEELNYPVTWREYAIGHSVSPEEIRDLSVWLQQVFTE